MLIVQEYFRDSMFIWVCTSQASGPSVLAQNVLFGILLLECKTWPSVLLNKEGLLNALGEVHNTVALASGGGRDSLYSLTYLH